MTSTDDRNAEFRAVLDRVLGGATLEQATARRVLDWILEGTLTPVQVAGLLTALRSRGETAEEIAGFVEAMRDNALAVRPRRDDLIDLCGTGGDGSHSINISTAAALVAAAAGAGVAKHGNRSASSQCGSADVLEALGVPIELEPERSAASIDELGFAFLFAPQHHPAMRHVAAARRELGVRTVFNILGPLSSPAGVRRQLIGVFDDSLRRLLAEVLARLESEHVWVVHAPAESGAGGLDELSIAGPTRVTELRGGRIEEFEVTPRSAGVEPGSLDALRGGDAAHNAARLEAILGGEAGPQLEAVVLNAGAALVVSGRAGELEAGVELARRTILSGRARDRLEELRRWR